eukprot:scaffold10501_cov141-Amphora_coffeaeformis.AAC.9
MAACRRGHFAVAGKTGSTSLPDACNGVYEPLALNLLQYGDNAKNKRCYGISAPFSGHLQ